MTARVWWDCKVVFERDGRRIEMKVCVDAPDAATAFDVKRNVLEDAPARNPELRGMRCVDFKATQRR